MKNHSDLHLQIGNFAVWINNDTEYATNIAAFGKTYKSMAPKLPFFIWRDASVQHFQVGTCLPGCPCHCCRARCAVSCLVSA